MKSDEHPPRGNGKIVRVLEIVAALAVNCFFALFVYSFVNCFAEWDHSLTHILQVPHDEQILTKETWAVTLYAAEAVVALFTAGLVFARKKFYLTLIGEAALVNLFFVYLLFLFISKYGKLFACL